MSTSFRSAHTRDAVPDACARRDRPYASAVNFTVTIDRDETGTWVAECPVIPGCVSQGLTKSEAIQNVREAIAQCLAVRAERGLPLTLETQQVEV
jgi:predicted RNase H-like HicB family nuclease